MAGYIASLICAIITFGMALLQLSLTFGAPFGEYVLGGRSKILPRNMRFVSASFTLAFAFIGMVYLHKAKVLDIGIDPVLVNVILIINTLFLAYAVVGNGLLTKSKKEKYLMTPFSAVQFLCSLIAILFK
jgi:hypothetical protein